MVLASQFPAQFLGYRLLAFSDSADRGIGPVSRWIALARHNRPQDRHPGDAVHIRYRSVHPHVHLIECTSCMRRSQSGARSATRTALPRTKDRKWQIASCGPETILQESGNCATTESTGNPRQHRSCAPVPGSVAAYRSGSPRFRDRPALRTTGSSTRRCSPAPPDATPNCWNQAAISSRSGGSRGPLNTRIFVAAVVSRRFAHVVILAFPHQCPPPVAGSSGILRCRAVWLCSSQCSSVSSLLHLFEGWERNSPLGDLRILI